MQQKLFNKFHKLLAKQSQKITQPANSITDKRQILHIFNNLYREQRFLEARIADYPEPLSTTILGINPKTNIMALDQLNSDIGHQLFLQNRRMQLSGSKNGVELECTLKLVAIKRASDIYYYQVALPEELIYVQRRNDHRVSLAGTSQFNGQLERQDRQFSVEGYAADLSLHGIGVVFKNQEPVHQSDKITSCKLQLPGESHLIFNLEVCFVQQIHQRGVERVGGRFLEMERRDSNRIAKIIRKVERKHAQLFRE